MIRILVSLVFLLATFELGAIRPKGKMYGSEQLVVESIEKELGKEFAIPFPKKGYDIDFWDKGDLVSFAEGEKPVLVTCPIVSGGDLYLAFGAGIKSDDYRMSGDVHVSFKKNGELSWLAVFPFSGKDHPTHEERVRRKTDESAQAYFERAKKHWIARASRKKGEITVPQLKAAFRVLEAALVQRPKAKIKAKKSDPTLEEGLKGS